jgi:hypothetical protein
VLAETLGTIVYQEQVIEVAMALAGLFTLDLVRVECRQGLADTVTSYRCPSN